MSLLQWRTAARIACLGLIPGLGLPLAASQVPEAKRRQSVFVVAVRTTSATDVLRPCPPPGRALPPEYFAALARFFPGSELVPAAGASLPGGVPDVDLQARVEREFRKNERYRLAASLDDADLVFFLQATWRADVKASITIDPDRPPSLYFNPGAPDEHVNRLVGAIAIAVPAVAYRRDHADNGALLKSALWGRTSGNAYFVSNVSTDHVSPESLARQFLRASLPGGVRNICARSQPPRAPDVPAPEAGPPLTVPLLHTSDRAAAAGRSPVFKTDIVAVAVPVRVIDERGAYVGDLTVTDFRLYEDDVEQRIQGLIPESEPLNVALVLDSSASMASFFKAVKAAASAFIDALRPGDRVMAVSFESRIRLVADLTAERSGIHRTLLGMHTGEDTTRLYDALAVTLERLDRVTGRKAIVLLTDGMDLGSGLADPKSVLSRLEATNVPLYVVQFDTASGSSQLGFSTPPRGWRAEMLPDDYFDKSAIFARATENLDALSHASGGRLERATSIGEVAERFSRVTEDLRHQYLLYYYPANQSGDGTFRRIRVAVGPPKLRIQSRTGYRFEVRQR